MAMTSPAAQPASTPRPVAAYLRQLRPILQQATETRQTFIHRLGAVMEQVRQHDLDAFAETVASVGAECHAHLRYVREQLVALEPPEVCQACHEAAVSWVELLDQAAQLVDEIGEANQPSRLRDVQSLLAEGRTFSNRMRVQYERLVAELRVRVVAKTPSRKGAISRLMSLGQRS